MIRRALLLLIAVLVSRNLLVAATAAPSLQDLTGIWTAGRNLETILAKRSPHAATAESVTISGQRLAWSNGHEASWRAIVRLESTPPDRAVLVAGPWEEEHPKPVDQIRIPLRLERDPAGRVKTLSFLDGTLVEAHGQPWVRLDEPVPAYLNRRLLAGTYRDVQGKTWKFSPDGQAIWPGRSFRYEVSTDDSEADCDYLFHEKKGEVGGYKRYGFRWDQGTLRLYEIAYPDDGAAPIHCAKVIAELRPV